MARGDKPTEIATIMLKERHSVRSKSLLRATIRFYNRNVTFDCLVRDISPTGAKLEFEGASALPQEFELAVPQRSAIYPCELKWRRQNTAGVRFKENVDPAAAEYGEFAKARIEALEKENAALRLEVSRLTLLLETSKTKGPKAPPRQP